MTATATATGFERPAKVHQALVAAAKLESGLKVVPEPEVLNDMLGLLVSAGVITAEQAHALWKLIEGGVLYPLPPLPGPDPQPGKVDPYQIIRIATLVPHDNVEFDAADAIIDAIVSALVDHALPVVVQAIGDAIDAVGSWLSGLFS